MASTNPYTRLGASQGLQRAFVLPPQFEDETELTALYDTLIEEFSAESRGVPMNTVQTLLLERIAFYYISLKLAERDNQITPVQMEKLNKFWLDMTAEFNKQLHSGHEKLREVLLQSIAAMVMEKLDVIDDRDTKQKMMLALKEGFAEMGL